MSLESFADMTYPGGKKPRRQASSSTPAPREEDAWDSRPIVKVIRGQEIELFTIGALGQALGGRAAVTMRMWERERIIPIASFRLANKNGLGGRRYYLRSQIEGIQRIAKEEGCLDKGSPITKDFSTKCFQLFADLKKGSTS